MMASRDAKAAVRRVQARSTRLASEAADERTPFRPLHETTTVAVRLVKSDAQAISALAADRGVPVSELLRAWILAGLRDEQGDSVDATLIQLEHGLSRLRKALG